jgi:ferritin-like metal-binding protein YciE
MQIESLQDMYIAELQELASVERQMAECLARVGERASHPTLKNALLDHREETATQESASIRSCRNTAQIPQATSTRPCKP